MGTRSTTERGLSRGLSPCHHEPFGSGIFFAFRFSIFIFSYDHCIFAWPGDVGHSFLLPRFEFFCISYLYMFVLRRTRASCPFSCASWSSSCADGLVDRRTLHWQRVPPTPQPALLKGDCWLW